MKLGITTIFVAVILSVVSAYYSVMGLTAIFAAAFWPIVIMGSSLEIGKVMTAMWLHKNWKISPITYKIYLVPALVLLMVLTSIGVFGFLSKAHLDQNVPSGDIQAQVQIFDDKIRTQKENIEAARKALTQMDSAVDQTMARSADINGASAAVNIRRSQARERTRLQNEISSAQEEVVRLQEQRAPVASKAREVEAEVGPIRYVAAMIYGDNADQNMLESAVRWMIILIVVVFDPLAIVLLLAGSKQLEWIKEMSEDEKNSIADDSNETLLSIQDELNRTLDEKEKLSSELDIVLMENDKLQSNITQVDVEYSGKLKESSDTIEDLTSENSELMSKNERLESQLAEVVQQWTDESVRMNDTNSSLMIRNFELGSKVDELTKKLEDFSSTDKIPNPLTPFVKSYADALDQVINSDDHIEADIQKAISDAIHPVEAAPLPKKINTQETVEARPIVMPDLTAKSDNFPEHVDNDFGYQFPANPRKGDMFLRVDFKPSKLYRYNGSKWMEKSKGTTDAYAFNQEYIKYLVNMIETGQYDIDDVSDIEKEEIEAYLKNNG